MTGSTLTVLLTRHMLEKGQTMRVFKDRRWIMVALAILVLRFWIGPVLIGTQMATGAFEPGGNCGNTLFRVPNTDLISWQLGGGTTTTFERACVAHDKCYGMIGQRKRTCDWAFWQDMRAGCQETYQTIDVSWPLLQVGQLGCRLQAETYFIAVAEPLLILAYCNEQYDARAGSSQTRPDLLTVLKECR
ncbi:MAG: hypothetical protein JXB07_06405 [Anaerolineae bacterium]|nr:hypothetical protein [Anaerolineae bacterium]